MPSLKNPTGRLFATISVALFEVAIVGLEFSTLTFYSTECQFNGVIQFGEFLLIMGIFDSIFLGCFTYGRVLIYDCFCTDRWEDEDIILNDLHTCFCFGIYPYFLVIISLIKGCLLILMSIFIQYQAGCILIEESNTMFFVLMVMVIFLGFLNIIFQVISYYYLIFKRNECNCIEN